jgi:hypothetical protein
MVMINCGLAMANYGIITYIVTASFTDSVMSGIQTVNLLDKLHIDNNQYGNSKMWLEDGLRQLVVKVTQREYVVNAFSKHH